MKASYCIETGTSLDKLKGVILVEWETLLRKVIASSEHESTVILMDHIPEILSQLESILKEGQVDEIELGKHHGYFRSMMTNYSLSDVLTEYSLLREVLIHNLYPMGDMGCSKLIHKFIDILTKHSVIEYLSTRSVHQSLAASALGSEIQELRSNPVIPTNQ